MGCALAQTNDNPYTKSKPFFLHKHDTYPHPNFIIRVTLLAHSVSYRIYNVNFQKVGWSGISIVQSLLFDVQSTSSVSRGVCHDRGFDVNQLQWMSSVHKDVHCGGGVGVGSVGDKTSDWLGGENAALWLSSSASGLRVPSRAARASPSLTRAARAEAHRTEARQARRARFEPVVDVRIVVYIIL